MKTNFPKLLFLIAPMLMASLCYGQAITMITPTPVAGAVCPSNGMEYNVSVPDGFEGCGITWSVDSNNGSISGGNTGTSVVVTWQEGSPNIAKLTATFSNCGTGHENNNNITATITQTILSISQETFTYGSSISIPYCPTTPRVNVSVSRMYVPNTGGIAQPPLQEVAYVWRVPAGWKQEGTNNAGPATVATTVNFINIVPVSCPVQATITVQGNINNTCGGSLSSQTATISLNITQTLAVTAPSGYTGSHCGNVSPVTFTVPSVSCATNYVWSFPSSWRGPNNETGTATTTTNSINLTPAGLPSDAGSIGANITLACGSIPAVSYTVPYVTPTPSIFGPSVICLSNTGIYPITNFPSGSSTTWTYSSNLVATSGQGTSSLTLTTASGVYNGQGTIQATMVGPCGIFVSNRTIWLGNVQAWSAPAPPDRINIVGSTNPSAGFVYGYKINKFPEGQGSITYRWTAPTGWSFTTSTNSTIVSVKVGTATGNIQVYWKNQCGTETGTFLYIPSTSGGGGGGPFPSIVYPNPVSDDLSIVLSDSIQTKDLSVQLLNRNGEVVHAANDKLQKISIPVNAIPEGIYYLQIKNNNRAETKQIVVKH